MFFAKFGEFSVISSNTHSPLFFLFSWDYDDMNIGPFVKQVLETLFMSFFFQLFSHCCSDGWLNSTRLFLSLLYLLLSPLYHWANFVSFCKFVIAFFSYVIYIGYFYNFFVFAEISIFSCFKINKFSSKHFYDCCFKFFCQIIPISVLSSCSCHLSFLIQVVIFLVFGMIGDFQLYSGYFGCYVRGLWVLFKSFILAGNHCSGLKCRSWHTL